MDRLIPLGEWEAKVKLYYYKGERGKNLRSETDTSNLRVVECPQSL